MIPGTLFPGSVQPVPAPIPALLAGVQPRASRSFNHVSGVVVGSTATLADLNACAWFQGGGRELRGPRRSFGVLGLKGMEDAKLRKQ